MSGARYSTPPKDLIAPVGRDVGEMLSKTPWDDATGNTDIPSVWRLGDRTWATLSFPRRGEDVVRGGRDLAGWYRLAAHDKFRRP